MSVHSGNLVLTINPRDDRKQELSNLIQKSHAPVYISQVAGFGQPELRIGLGEYVRGVAAIRSIIHKNRRHQMT